MPSSRSSEGEDEVTCSEVPLTWALDAADAWEAGLTTDSCRSRSKQRNMGRRGAIRSASPTREARLSSNPYRRRPTRGRSADRAPLDSTPSATDVDIAMCPPTSASAQVLQTADHSADTLANGEQNVSPRFFDDTDTLRFHAEALVSAVGDQARFGALSTTEQQRRVHCLTRFLCSVVKEDEEATHGEANEDDPTVVNRIEAVAEALADGLRRTAALGSLSAMVSAGGFDSRLALSCLANLARCAHVPGDGSSSRRKTAFLGDSTEYCRLKDNLV